MCLSTMKRSFIDVDLDLCVHFIKIIHGYKGNEILVPGFKSVAV